MVGHIFVEAKFDYLVQNLNWQSSVQRHWHLLRAQILDDHWRLYRLLMFVSHDNSWVLLGKLSRAFSLGKQVIGCYVLPWWMHLLETSHSFEVLGVNIVVCGFHPIVSAIWCVFLRYQLCLWGRSSFQCCRPNSCRILLIKQNVNKAYVCRFYIK